MTIFNFDRIAQFFGRKPKPSKPPSIRLKHRHTLHPKANQPCTWNEWQVRRSHKVEKRYDVTKFALADVKKMHPGAEYKESKQPDQAEEPQP